MLKDLFMSLFSTSDVVDVLGAGGVKVDNYTENLNNLLAQAASDNNQITHKEYSDIFPTSKFDNKYTVLLSRVATNGMYLMSTVNFSDTREKLSKFPINKKCLTLMDLVNRILMINSIVGISASVLDCLTSGNGKKPQSKINFLSKCVAMTSTSINPTLDVAKFAMYKTISSGSSDLLDISDYPIVVRLSTFVSCSRRALAIPASTNKYLMAFKERQAYNDKALDGLLEKYNVTKIIEESTNK